MHGEAEKEWANFLAECWERGEAPGGEAWTLHLRRAAQGHLRKAQELLRYSLDPDDERVESHDEAADLLIARLNSGTALFRLSGVPNVDWDRYPDDYEAQAAFEARGEALKTMPYGEYLRTSEWSERRRGALRRADYSCEACGGHGSGLHVHHRTYDRRGEEKPDDLIVLCEDCHLAVHTSGGSHRPARLRPV
jgi:hypothetical protein